MDAMNLDAWQNYNFNELDANDQPILKCLKYLEDKSKETEKDIKVYNYPTLKNLVKSNKVLEGDLSFYFYMGSDSKPPCEEKITRFIMVNPAKIDAGNFAKMQKKILVEG